MGKDRTRRTHLNRFRLSIKKRSGEACQDKMGIYEESDVNDELKQVYQGLSHLQWN